MTPLETVLLLAAGAAGAAVGRLVRLPFWPLTGSLLGVAGMNLASGGALAVPGWWSVLAQVLVGSAVGATIVPGVFRDFRSVLVPGVLAVVAILGVGVVTGLLLAAVVEVDPVAAVFGTVPGGVGEMVAAATALQADSALVAGMHVIRLLVVLWSLPWLVRWARRWSTPNEDPT